MVLKFVTALVQENGIKNLHSEECQGMDCVFTITAVSLNIFEGVLFTDCVKRLESDGYFQE